MTIDSLLDSPYTPGVMATSTPGREPQRAAHDRILVSVAGSGTFHGRIQVVQGARGVGKTSLLRATERKARDLGLATAFVTASPGAGLTLVGDALSGLVSELAPASATERFLAAVSKVGVKADPLEAAIDISRTPAPDNAVSNLKHAVATVARVPSCRGLVLFVDELQDMPAADIRTLAAAWQEMDAEVRLRNAPAVPAALITAGLSNTQEQITAGASFGERFRFENLRNLDPAAAEEAVLAPALASDVGWDRDAARLVCDTSAGYPYFLQLYADETWNVAFRRPADRITVDEARAGIDRAADQVTTFYRGRWNRATPSEKDLLLAIARSGGEELERSRIAESMGVRSSDLGVARASLLGKGLLAVPRRGVLAFNAPGFGRFILDEVDG